MAASVERVRQKTGRPSKYRPEFCERVVKLGIEGYSKAQMARDIGISIENFMDWEKRWPDFGSAVKNALGKSLAHWEEMGERGCLMGKDFNAVTYIFIMKNRFREHYNDAKQFELGDSFMRTWQAISEGKKSEPKTIDQETRPFRQLQKAEEVAS